VKNLKLADETRSIGKPEDWDEALDGPCLTISVHDFVDPLTGVPFMLTAWTPEPDELQRLNEGRPLFLAISGRTHPVIKLFVGDK
jgi:hypothetical protein